MPIDGVLVRSWCDFFVPGEQKSAKLLKSWSEWQDLNLRPHRPERRRLAKSSTDSTKLIRVNPVSFYPCSANRCEAGAK